MMNIDKLEVLDFDDFELKDTNTLIALNEEINRIDRLLLDLNKVLFITQPYGKDHIGISFFKPRGGSNTKQPYVIKTLGYKRFTKIKEKHLAKRALSKGQFAINYKETQFALRIASNLMDYRKKLTDLRGRFERSFKLMLKANQEWVSIADGNMDVLVERAISNLRKKGYSASFVLERTKFSPNEVGYVDESEEKVEAHREKWTYKDKSYIG